MERGGSNLFEIQATAMHWAWARILHYTQSNPISASSLGGLWGLHHLEPLAQLHPDSALQEWLSDTHPEW